MQRLVPRISDVDRPPEIVVSNVSPYHNDCRTSTSDIISRTLWNSTLCVWPILKRFLDLVARSIDNRTIWMINFICFFSFFLSFSYRIWVYLVQICWTFKIIASCIESDYFTIAISFSIDNSIVKFLFVSESLFLSSRFYSRTRKWG